MPFRDSGIGERWQRDPVTSSTCRRRSTLLVLDDRDQVVESEPGVIVYHNTSVHTPTASSSIN